VACAGAVPRPDVAERIRRKAPLEVPGALTATVEGHVVLLHPDGTGNGPPVTWFEEVVARVRTLAPSTRAQAIAAQAPVEPGELRAQVTHLLRLSRLGSRAEGGPPVVFAERYALDRLLWDHVAAADARGFVDERLGALIAWDREHRSDLLRVLEAALDFPRHDRAASRCYMHRNTFRNRLKQATDLLGDDLDDPDVRLAVHVALKLRRGLTTHGEPRSREAQARRDGASEPAGAGRSR
jgi:DNA-binding PucR family transcriptional regulator